MPGVKKFLQVARQIEEQRHRKLEVAPVRQDEGEGNWLISYADMMTLLCGFFIMLFSMATLDAPKYDSFKSAIVRQFGAAQPDATQEQSRMAIQILQELGVEKDFTVRADPYGVSIAFSSTLFFDTLSADIRIQGQIILGRLVELLAERQRAGRAKYRVVVEGHTDSRPILGGNYPSNWELSAARAARVVRLFLDRGFAPGQMTAIGYGDTRPEDPADRTPAGDWNEDALARNRRVVIRILNPGVQSIPLADSALTEVYGPPSPAGTAGPAH